MKSIPLTQGATALVDDEDYPMVAQHKWHLLSGACQYARMNIPRLPEKKHNRGLLMHRLILDPPTGISVDHINGDGLDNRRCNLRLATTSENGRNSRRPKSNTSGYKGVCYLKRNDCYQAQIQSGQGKILYLGVYKTAEDAGRAYDAKAREIYGQFAKLNFPDDSTPPANRIVRRAAFHRTA